jgi:phosphoribosylamine--glycine ligase / phosphoribosylformylglycinamidine cyclo-ligase
MHVLLIGSGGREHAIATSLCKSDSVSHVFVSPGNGGTVTSKSSNVTLDSFADMVTFAVSKGVKLVVVGPEVPLVDGIEAVFRKVGIPVFGPSKEAAELEGSKAFSKAFMKRWNIPTAAFEVSLFNGRCSPSLNLPKRTLKTRLEMS